jgi:hypothetical protein
MDDCNDRVVCASLLLRRERLDLDADDSGRRVESGVVERAGDVEPSRQDSRLCSGSIRNDADTDDERVTISTACSEHRAPGKFL